MKSRLLVIALAALALVIGLPNAAHAACPAGQIDLSINNISPASVDICFTISGQTLTFVSISGAPASGGSFVRFDELSIGGTAETGVTYTAGSATTPVQTWSVDNTKCLGSFDGLGGGPYATGICGSTSMNPQTPTGSSWLFTGGTLTSTGPITAHVIFSTGCTFFAASNGTSNSGGTSGSCSGTTTPEPGTLFLFGGGLLGVAGLVRRKLLI